jgi:uncharacterized membrane protein
VPAAIQATYAAPLILLAGNRAAAHDRATLEHAAAQADLEEKQNLGLAGADGDHLGDRGQGRLGKCPT